jgi:hypothetical protein
MELYAYCLMPNPFHVLGRPKPLPEAIADAIGWTSCYMRSTIPSIMGSARRCADYPHSSYHDCLSGNGERAHLAILRHFQDSGLPSDSPSAALESFVQAHEKYRLAFRT